MVTARARARAREGLRVRGLGLGLGCCRSPLVTATAWRSCVSSTNARRRPSWCGLGVRVRARARVRAGVRVGVRVS